MGILPPPTVAAPAPPPTVAAPNPDNGSMTLRDFAMFMSGNTRMNRNNALQDNIDDDEEMPILDRADSPTSFNNVIDNSNAINPQQKVIIKQEFNNKVIGQYRRMGTVDGQSILRPPPRQKYANHPEFGQYYMESYNRARTQLEETGARIRVTRDERAAARAARVERAGVEEAGAAGTPVKATGNDREIFELSDLRDQLENMVRKRRPKTPPKRPSPFSPSKPK